MTLMFEATATEFPFVQEMPKRERPAFLKVWDAFKEYARVSEAEGSLVPIPFAAKVLDVSRQRVYELIEDGRLKVLRVNGHTFVTGNSVVAYADTERKAGRPLKVALEAKERGENRTVMRIVRETLKERAEEKRK